MAFMTSQEYAGLAIDGASAELGIWRWDLILDRVQVCDRLAAILGVERAGFTPSLEGFLECIHPEDRDHVWDELGRGVRTRRPFAWEARALRPDGSVRRLLAQGCQTESAGGCELVSVLHDITHRDATRSGLGVLEQRLSHILAESPAMIAIKSLDHRYLMANQQVANHAGLPLEQILGRPAAEIFPEVGPQIVANAAEAMASDEAVHTDVVMGQGATARTFHLISFALRDGDGQPVEVCCIATDVTAARRQQARVRLERETDELISSALRESRMRAARQPVTDISGTRVASEELLVRLCLPDDGGVLHPAGFLPRAERFGLVQPIDIWMVGRAIGLAAERPVQVNLSGVTFSDAEARETIVAALARAPEAARRIIFEITETAAAHNLDAAVQFARQVTELGCGLALDDFGVGFGSFTYLRRLPLRYLKIDRSFVSGLAGSSDDRRVVASIISIARQFELATIAEGVEDAETLEILGELGADYAQGFYLGRPAIG